MNLIKQSQTAQVLMFLMLDSSDHVSAKTGLSPTVTLSKNGASFASPSGAVTEVGSGWYKVAGNATDTNTLGPLVLHATGSGADPCDVVFEVVAFDPQDSVRAGLTALPNAAAEAAGGLYTRGSGAGQINQPANGQVDVNAVKILGTAIATPATAGVLDVNVKNVNNVSASSVTAVNANQGTTQPVNFTGTGASALAKSDMVDVAGAAVSTSTAQLGVNMVSGSANAITASVVAADAIGASELAADAVTEIADGILKRDMSAVTGESARSPLNAFRKLMNKIAIVSGVLHVKKEDDSTDAFTQNVSTDAAAEPVTGLDTV